jgi:hypothetical protein
MTFGTSLLAAGLLIPPSLISGASVTVGTSSIRTTVDGLSSNDVCIWEAGADLVQDWSVGGWGSAEGEFFFTKSGALQCTDLVAKCTIDAQGGGRNLAVMNSDSVQLTGLVITGGNTGGDGGGIYISSSVVTFTACEIRDNTSGSSGGGMAVFGTANLFGTSFSGNAASNWKKNWGDDIADSDESFINVYSTCPVGYAAVDGSSMTQGDAIIGGTAGEYSGMVCGPQFSFTDFPCAPCAAGSAGCVAEVEAALPCEGGEEPADDEDEEPVDEEEDEEEEEEEEDDEPADEEEEEEEEDGDEPADEEEEDEEEEMNGTGGGCSGTGVAAAALAAAAVAALAQQY